MTLAFFDIGDIAHSFISFYFLSRLGFLVFSFSFVFPFAHFRVCSGTDAELNIQGDLIYDIAEYLITNFKVPQTSIYVIEKNKPQPIKMSLH